MGQAVPGKVFDNGRDSGCLEAANLGGGTSRDSIWIGAKGAAANDPVSIIQV
jgi:hypothetical protein